jgi:hypothetical protein
VTGLSPEAEIAMLRSLLASAEDRASVWERIEAGNRGRFANAIEEMAECLDREHAWSREAIQAVKTAGFIPSWERQGGEAWKES